MSKGNLLLGFARGKVGDLVFFRQAGEQITRARNTSPKNPQTALQLLQRVVMKTNAQAFSLLQDICNHSFQGLSGVTPNQSRFSRLNVALLRSYLAEEINSGDPGIIAASLKTNFSTKDSSLAQLNPYIISEGTIAPLSYYMDYGPIALVCGTTAPTSYADVISGLGLQRGDQLTFIGLSVDDTKSSGVFNSVKIARVILEPAGGDLSVDFRSTDGTINDPNPRNEGDVRIAIEASSEEGRILIDFPSISTSSGQVNTMAAGAVIASRLSGSIWQRSTQQLALRPASGSTSFSNNQQVNTLGDAVLSFVSEANSTLYLNQAENF